MDRIGWENGTLVSKAKVNINGTIYEVEPEQYSGNTPLSAENLKKMEDNFEEAILDIEKTIENATILEKNTINGITYIKYDNGSLVQYGTHTYAVSTDAAYFNIGYRSTEYLFGGESYPVSFIKLDSLQISDNCLASNSFITAIRRNNDKLNKLPKITYISAGRESTQLAIDCSFLAVGTWK